MTNVMFVLAVIIEIGLPIALAIWLTRRYKFGWGIVGVGVLTFIASQIVHIPLLAGLALCAALPASAGQWGEQRREVRREMREGAREVARERREILELADVHETRNSPAAPSRKDKRKFLNAENSP